MRARLLPAAIALLVLGPAPGASAETFTVSSRADAGPGTLRAAMAAANANSNPGTTDSIEFDAAARGGTIELATALPAIVEPVEIDGCDPTVAPAKPCVGLRGPTGPGADGLRVAADSVELRGLAITRTARAIVHEPGAAGLLVRGSWLGVRLNTTVEGNGRGLVLDGLGGTIGVGDGASSQAGRNVIVASAGPAVDIGGSYYAVRGNRIGLTAAGVSAPNGPEAVSIAGPAASDNVIGGEGLSEQNQISGHAAAAIAVHGPGERNLILANRGANPGARFIDLAASLGMSPPAIASATSEAASGTALPGATVRLFRRDVDDPGALDVYIGKYGTNPDGLWQATYRPMPPGLFLVATQTVPSQGTSELTASTAYADVTAPETRITAGPDGRTEEPAPEFAFEATEAGAGFQCSVDFGSWEACTAPARTGPFRDGWHTFQVRAVDAAGNVDATPALRRFGVPRATAASTPAAAAPRLAAFRLGALPTHRRLVFRFWLSEPATVQVTVGRRTRRGGWKRVALVSRAGVAGANVVRIRRPARRRLARPGRYRAMLGARDETGARAEPALIRWTMRR